MKLKTYIAFILCILFCSKLLLVEAKAFSLWDNVDGITFTNPYCKKKNAKSSSKELNVSASKDHSLLVFSFTCQQNFQLTSPYQEIWFQEKQVKEYAYQHPQILVLFKELQLPPPKLV